MRYGQIVRILAAWGVLMAADARARGAGIDPDSTPPSRLGVDEEAVDVHSWGNPQQVRVTHLSLELGVDFESKRIAGDATLELRRNPGGPADAALWLDTRGLEVSGVADVTEQGGEPRPLEFRIVDPEVPEAERRLFPEGVRSDGAPIHGRPLVIDLDGADRVRISYQTAPSAEALQWLEPAQTAGGRQPFLFSQSQAIHARSWIPLQDSPGVRVTYDATIRPPEGLKAVMSASGNFGTEGPVDGPFRFAMEQPIPPYLIALAVGDLEFRALGPRTGVYAEPPIVEAAASEFDDTEAMIATTEARYGPYRWGRYDLLVLPPSFPFGGMENPRLTFATPTVLAGDKSLVSLVAHELAHSWSGNLVTNATWDDFWLNEGFTSYLERRIIEDVYGADRAAMEEALALAGLRDELETLEPRDQVLDVDLWGRDPDDNVTAVPYDKGAFLLRQIERRVGRDVFDEFLRGYFDRFAFQSITTEQSLDALNEFLDARQIDLPPSVDLDAWVHQPGLPEVDEPQTDRFDAVDRQASSWLSGDIDAAGLQIEGWTTQEWLRFIDAMPDDLPAARVGELDRTLMLTRRQNAEIACRWLELAIRTGYGEADARLDRFLTTVGRRKFLMPLYTAMIEAGELDRARTIYAMARPKYHPIAVESVDRLLGAP